MSKRLIIVILVVLIVGVVAGTVFVLFEQLGNGDDTSTTPSPTATPTATTQQTVNNPDADDDNDGLTNAQEILWGTNPNNPDTDGDTYKDGEEVAASHDPTKAGPNDKLSANYQPQQSGQGDSITALQADQYFVSNNDQVSRPANYTEQYKKDVPSKDSQTPASLIQYAQSQPVTTKLPITKQDQIKVSKDNSKLATAADYAVLSNLQAITNKKLLNDAIWDLFNEGDASSTRQLATNIRSYQTQLLTSSATNDTAALHRVMVGYTELLAGTFEQMAQWENDPVGGLVAIRQLDEIDRAYYPIISSEIQRLGNVLSSQ